MRKLFLLAAFIPGLALAAPVVVTPPSLNWGGNITLPAPGTSIGTTQTATTQATVGTTATPVVASRAGRGLVTIVNTSTTDVYIGGAGVTTATGSLLPGTKGASLTLPSGAAFYGVVGTGTAVVTVLETY